MLVWFTHRPQNFPKVWDLNPDFTIGSLLGEVNEYIGTHMTIGKYRFFFQMQYDLAPLIIF